MPKIEIIIGSKAALVQAWFQKTFNDFSQQSNIDVHNTFSNWDDYWQELLNMAIYRHGPDLAEVGTTWMESLAAMNALRPFSSKEVTALGGEAAFLPASWRTASIGKDSQILGIPFRADVRIIFYWADIIEKAGIDPEKDFSSPAALHKTLKTLQTSLQYPWAISTHPKDHNTLYNSASWVWAHGGDFISKDGLSVAFNHPKALEGWNDFFSLKEFMPPLDTPLTDLQAFELFANRKIAAFVGGPWALPDLQAHPLSKGSLSSLGMALPPGPAFVGGTVLVIWEYSRSPEAAFELIRYMCQPKIQAQLSSVPGLLPANASSWEETIRLHPYYKVYNQALTSGRPLPVTRLWGMIEGKLTVALGQIWATLGNDQSADVKKTIHSILDPLADRLNTTLSS